MRCKAGKRAVSSLAVLLFVSLLVLLYPRKGNAIPAFSRLYGTSCATCHVDFPKLNDFGKAFKDAGFKFPKDDAAFIKIPPVMLGAPAQKEMWPHSIWPGTVPGIPQLGLRMNSFLQVVGHNRGRLANSPDAPGTAYIPRADFATGLFSIFTAGNFGSGIAYWVDDDFSVGGQNAAGGLGDGYLKFVDVGHLVRLPKDSFSIRAGQFELDLPFTQARSYNLSGYDILGQPNIGVVDASLANPQPDVNNNFTMDTPGQGVEFSGGHDYGGYHYSFAVVNQNTSGDNATTAPNVTPYNEVAFMSDSNFKDLYARFAYRFNLERDPKSRNAVQAAGPMGPRDHTSIRIGTFYFYGRAAQRFLDSNSLLLGTAREPFYRVGGDLDFHYRNFNLYGMYMYAHDHDLMPATFGAGGNITSYTRGAPVTFDGGFVQADYMVFPWMMTSLRWDAVNSPSDRQNGLQTEYVLPDGSLVYGGPRWDTRNRYTPAVQFLIHANIKAAFEYEVQPEFAEYDGSGTLTRTFRTNAAIFGLDYVY
jgi:hypothetical protein